MIAACQRDKIAAAIKIAKAIVLQARSKSRRCVGVMRRGLIIGRAKRVVCRHWPSWQRHGLSGERVSGVAAKLDRTGANEIVARSAVAGIFIHKVWIDPFTPAHIHARFKCRGV